MVKGTAKRVIVVKSPDPKIFEQAIFIVKEDYLGRVGTKSADVLKQAQKVADDYVRDSVSKPKLLARIPPAVYAAFGALCAGIVWAALSLAGL